MKRPSWCPCPLYTCLDHLCLECLRTQTENFVERTAIKTSLKEPVAELIRAMVDDEFPEDERHA